MEITNDSSIKKSSCHCCVPNCMSDGRYDSGLHFHHIPKDPDIRKQWTNRIRREEGAQFTISQSTVVCSKHFKKEDYKGWNPVRKRLNPNAVPSVFNWSSEKKPRRAQKKRVPIVGDVKLNLEQEREVTCMWTRSANF